MALDPPIDAPTGFVVLFSHVENDGAAKPSPIAILRKAPSMGVFLSMRIFQAVMHRCRFAGAGNMVYNEVGTIETRLNSLYSVFWQYLQALLGHWNNDKKWHKEECSP